MGKPRKHTPEQIVNILRQIEVGISNDNGSAAPEKEQVLHDGSQGRSSELIVAVCGCWPRWILSPPAICCWFSGRSPSKSILRSGHTSPQTCLSLLAICHSPSRLAEKPGKLGRPGSPDALQLVPGAGRLARIGIRFPKNGFDVPAAFGNTGGHTDCDHHSEHQHRGYPARPADP